jgi:hypothetical protein
MRWLRKEGRHLIGDVVAGIPLSIAAAAIIWFFIHVIGGVHLSFWITVKWAYIAMLALAVLEFLYYQARMSLTALDLRVKYGEVWEAVRIYRLHKRRKPKWFRGMTRDEFRQSMEVARLTRAVAKSIVSAIYGE